MLLKWKFIFVLILNELESVEFEEVVDDEKFLWELQRDNGDDVSGCIHYTWTFYDSCVLVSHVIDLLTIW